MFNKSSRTALRLTILLFILLMTASWSGRLLAQSNTPTTKTLPLNKTISGQLRGKGEKVTYRLDIPIDQDVIVEYRANKLVFSYDCIFTDESASDDHCTDYGGSGGDRPTTDFDLITTFGQQNQQATVTLIRVLDGASTYQITAYPITPQAVNLGENVNSTPIKQSTYQIYTMDADPTVPFTVDVEDEAADGNFLWAAYQPFTLESFPAVERQQIFLPEYMDGASDNNGASGINLLELYYLGGRTFSVLVRSPKSYQLFTTNADLPTLDANHQITTTISYRQPIMVTQLNIQPGEQAQVNFNVSVGKGAIVRVYEVGSPIDKALSLGAKRADGTTFELSGNVQRTAVKALYVVVQLPFDYTRDKVNVEVMWQPIN